MKYVDLTPVVIALLLVLGPAGGAVRAQSSDADDHDAATSAIEGTTETAPPVAIPASEIAVRATETVGILNDLHDLADPIPQIETIAADLPDLVATIELMGDDPVNLYPEGQPPSMLEDAMLQWERLEARFEGWEQSLNSRSHDIEDARAEVAEQREIWTLTAAELAAADRPAAVTEQVRTVLAQIDATDSELQARQDAVLTLQNQLSEHMIAIDARTDAIDAALAAGLDDVFQRDSTPVWRVGTVDLRSPGVLIRQARQRLVDSARIFLPAYRTNIIKQFILFLVLAAVIFVLNRKALKYAPESAEFRAASHVLSHPLLAAGLLTLIASGLFYPFAPLTIKNLIPILGLPIAALLAHSLVPRSLLGLLYFMLALTFFGIVQEVFLDEDPLRRVILFAIQLTGIAGVGWLRKRADTLIAFKWSRIVIAAAQWGGILFGAALVANLLGYVGLAQLITYAVLKSAYIGFVFLAAVGIVEALVLVSLRSGSAQSLATVRRHTTQLQRWTGRLIRLAAFVLWIWFTLKNFHIHRTVAHFIESWLTHSWQIGSLQISPMNIVAFFVVVWVARLVAKSFRGLLEDDLLPRAGVEFGMATTISTLVSYALLAAGVLLAMAASGIDVRQFSLLAGALGLGIGFGLQNIVNNFVSGLILVFERPIAKGDKVQIGELVGDIRQIGIRASTLRTLDGADVVVPNADFVSNQVINWTLRDRQRRISVEVGVAYGTDPVQVQELLVRVARENSLTLDDPEPYALFRGFGESSLQFELRFWVAEYEHGLLAASEIAVAINAELKAAGIVIPFPQRDVHIDRLVQPTPRPAAEDEDPSHTVRPGSVSPDSAPED